MARHEPWRAALSEVLVRPRRLLRGLALVFMLSQGALAADNEATWESIRPEIFGARPIEDGAPVLDSLYLEFCNS